MDLTEIKPMAPGKGRYPVGYMVGLALLGVSLILGAEARAQTPAFRVLVFHGVGGFLHDAIPNGNKLIQDLGAQNNFAVDLATAGTVFTAANLARYKVVVWNNTTKPGSILNVDQKTAYLAWAKKGGYFGIHGATDTEGTWPEIIDLVGAQLSTHGTGDPYVRVDPEGRGHEVTAGMDDSSRMDEEWYSFKTNPRGVPGIKIMYVVDENTCRFCVKMGDHPVVWTREIATGGRVFYMAMGHMSYVFQNHAFSRKLILNALQWTAKAGTPTVVAGGPAGHTGPALASSPDASRLNVAFPEAGPHSVEILTVQGRLVASRVGSGRRSYDFPSLRPGSVYAVITRSSAGRIARRVAIP